MYVLLVKYLNIFATYYLYKFLAKDNDKGLNCVIKKNFIGRGNFSFMEICYMFHDK